MFELTLSSRRLGKWPRKEDVDETEDPPGEEGPGG